MTVSLAACLLAALLGTGSGLQCEVCAAVGQTCSGSLQPCPAGQDSCGIFLSEVTLGEIKSQTILKSCVTPSLCTAGPSSVHFGMGMTRTGVACCTGDSCRTVNVTLPPPDTKPNGRRCPACFSVFAGQCSEKIVSCTGSETQCIESAGTVNMGQSSLQTVMKGCASESACAQLKVDPGTVAGISVTVTTAKCTAAPSAMGLALGLAGRRPPPESSLPASNGNTALKCIP